MWSREKFEARLRGVGEAQYHDSHPFNLRMHAGTLRPDELRCWVLNRYYYQTRIPLKDANILTKAADAPFRREWIQRIHDHDGDQSHAGGLELWLQLAEAVGLDRSEVQSLQRVVPGVRVACDAYVEFVAGHDLLESVASSLTEMFAGGIMARRITAFEKHYPWVKAEGLRYFHSRTVIAPRDSAFGLEFVLEHALTPKDQQRCVAALERKCEILWSLLDAVEQANRRPKLTSAVDLRKDPGDPARWLAVLPERALRLNASSHEILTLCDGERSRDEIATELWRRHPEADGVVDEVHQFLAELSRQGAIRDAD